MKKLLTTLSLLLAAPALGASLPDPFFTRDIGQVLPVCNGSWQCNAPFRDTSAKTLVRAPLDLTKRTLILMENGQSNGENEAEQPYIATHASQIYNFNYLDQGLYQGTDPQLGASLNATKVGYMNSMAADLVIDNGWFDQVVLVPENIGGSPVQHWADGGPLQDVPCIALHRLAQIGITPSTPNVFFVNDWTQGESNRQGPTQVGTTQAQYTTWLSQVYNRLRGCGFQGRFFTNIVTWSGTDTWPPVAAAQASMVNGVDEYVGGNLDSLNNYYRYDMTHFNFAYGLPAGAHLKVDAWHASGVPFQ